MGKGRNFPFSVLLFLLFFRLFLAQHAFSVRSQLFPPESNNKAKLEEGQKKKTAAPPSFYRRGILAVFVFLELSLFLWSLVVDRRLIKVIEKSRARFFFRVVSKKNRGRYSGSGRDFSIHNSKSSRYIILMLSVR